jgi:DNA (cytosine-5)-methyltransferase 1
MHYYNEIDPKACAWLRELMKAGLIPEGVIDDRSIVDVRPDDLRGFRQCHFFAGIAGWAEALRLAQWPDDRDVWTASCPCQPFSVAGKGRAHSDERHLWPILRQLVRVRRPATVIGEQVASPLGRKWLAGVFADLEGMGYACAGADLCAASVGAPHIRQRLYWVGNASSDGREVRQQLHGELRGTGFGEGCAPCRHKCTDGKTRRISPEPGVFPLAHGVSGRMGLLRGYGNAIVPACAAEFIKAFLEL